MKREIFRAFLRGGAFAAGFIVVGLFAATVSGTINTFSSGAVISATQINTNFSSLRTAIEAINPAYSTSETVTDQVWIDGRSIYRTTINVGAMPTKAGSVCPHDTKTVAHGISGINTVVKAYGWTHDGTRWLPLPFVQHTATGVAVYAESTNIIMETCGDYSGYTTGYVVLEYTK